ncbi:MAG: protein-glutamate O-methyltransferase CheR [Magnetococcales bacterium]|nr:protein-glutamate O-methyltransferase CheR [Magnetococcales bacterium]
MELKQIQDIEVQLLIKALYLRYGYDFSNYATASLRRRILQCLSSCEFSHISEIIPQLLHEGRFHRRLIFELSVTVTEMFRDPYVFKALRTHVIPHLKTFPFVNIWIAGCATGEEVYSLAILLHEEGIYDRVRIYATDFNDEALQQAQEGVFPAGKMAAYGTNYQKAGGTGSLSDYYHARYDLARMDAALKENIVFANHNLVGDAVFCETELIMCRNVMIYFNRKLQDTVFELFTESLSHGGFLCIGTRESLQFSSVATQFQEIRNRERIYQKKK